MKMIFFVSFLAIGALAACGEAPTQQAAQRNFDAEVMAVCRDHVQYLRFPNSHGASYTARLKVDGKPYTC